MAIKMVVAYAGNMYSVVLKSFQRAGNNLNVNLAQKPGDMSAFRTNETGCRAVCPIQVKKGRSCCIELRFSGPEIFIRTYWTNKGFAFYFYSLGDFIFK